MTSNPRQEILLGLNQDQTPVFEMSRP